MTRRQPFTEDEVGRLRRMVGYVDTDRVEPARDHFGPISAMASRAALLSRKEAIEDRLVTARTVGEVWRINEQLDAIDDALDDR